LRRPEFFIGLDDIHIQGDGMRLDRDWVPKFIHQEEKKKMNQKEKKKRNEVSQEELLAAVNALEEIIKAQMLKDRGDKGKVGEEKLPTAISSLEKVKNKIRRKLLENDGELTRSNLYRAVRGDRMGLVTFNWALQSLEDNQEIAIVKKDTRGRPVEKIKLLRVIGDGTN
jgi:hypothetical protein